MKNEQDYPNSIQELNTPILHELGVFFRIILENLAHYFRNRSSFEIELPFLGMVAIEDLDLLFRLLWQFFGRAEDERFYIVLHMPSRVNFCLEIKSGGVAAFFRVQEGAGGLDINVEKFAAIPERKAAIFLAIMRSEGIRLDGERLLWHKIARKVRISPDSLDLLNRWFFPISGMGVLLWLKHRALMLIYYGGKGKLVLIGAHKGEDIVSLTQRFRQQHGLSLAISLDIDFARDCLCQNTEFLRLSHYGKKWVISVPLEPNDFILGDFYRFLPWKETCKRCNIDYEHISALLRNYLANMWKYLKCRPIYLTLKDQRQSLLMEVTLEGVCEIEKEKIEPQDHFTIDLEMLSTFMAWSNHTSLRLVSDFLDEALPAEICEKFACDETLVLLQLQDEKQHLAELFISGGQHRLSGDWDGDFCVLLTNKNSQRLLFSESLENVPLLVSESDGVRSLRFPPSSALVDTCVKFTPTSEGQTTCGIARLISSTSLVANIVPGLRTTMLFGQVKRQRLTFAGRDYRIVSGSILLSKTQGRIVKRCGFERTLFHTWITKTKGGCAVSAIHEFNESPQWNKFVSSSGEAILEIDSENAQEYLPPEVFLPRLFEGVVEAKKVGWKKRNFQKMRFWVLKAWAVPCDKRGNFLIRVRTRAKIGDKFGFALLEFPCYVPGILDRMRPVPLSVKIHKHNLEFIAGGYKILSIEGDYLRIEANKWWHRLLDLNPFENSFRL